MNTNILTFLFLALCLLFHTTNAGSFNITTILAENSTFNTFNKYLTDFGLATEINERETITVLAVKNHAMDLLSGKPKEVVKKILSVHVLLDFYDFPKMKSLNGNTSNVTTLFQTSGQARDEGLLKVTGSNTTGATFTVGPSGGSGNNVKATVVGDVAAKPYNLSVVEITQLIVPPGIERTSNTPAPNQANAPSSSHPGVGGPGSAHAPASPKHPRGPSPSGPGGDDSSSSGTPSSPKAHTPSASDTPTSDDSGSPASTEGSSDNSYAVRIGFDTLLATKLMILACLWMI